MTPNDPRHGSPAGYRAGCRETCCRTSIARYNERRRLAVLQGLPTSDLVPAIGTHRRIQALAALGWSYAAIGAHAGADKARIRCILGQGKVTRDLEARFAAAYDQLAMRIPTGHASSINRIRNRAAALHWAPPLAWEGIDIDDPRARPVRGPRGAGGQVDEVAVLRALDGDTTVRLTRAERFEVVARARAKGWTLHDIEQRTPITKPERYLTHTRQEAT